MDVADELWTMTSTMGFEALLRGVPVACLGAPFYAGWELTQDLGDVPDRRKVEVSLAGLVHATLIDYPRYWDPVSGQSCPVEVVLERFARGEMRGKSPPSIRLLAKSQGVFASYAHIWR